MMGIAENYYLRGKQTIDPPMSFIVEGDVRKEDDVAEVVESWRMQQHKKKNYLKNGPSS